MKIPITKAARQYGYLIWNSKTEPEIEKIFKGLDKVKVIFNNFNLGEKKIDRRYHRLSLGYKLTRALPIDHTIYEIKMNDDGLEVTSSNG